jgi:hypothetical protein
MSISKGVILRTLVPKDLARVVTFLLGLEIRFTPDASQAHHDASAEERSFQTGPLASLRNPLRPLFLKEKEP